MADILASDVNAIRTKISQVLGTGVASKGYGQTIYSNNVTAGSEILKSQWDALRYDIVNVFQHQQGTVPAIATITLGDVITDDAGDALQNFNYYADLASDNRFDVASGEYNITSIADDDTSSSWSNSASATLTMTFSDSDEARYFFNSGGKIRVTSSLALGASPTAQSNAWNNILASVGSQDFAGNLIAATGFYTLTNTYQEYYQSSISTPYSANNYQLAAKCNVADNSLGTATEVTIRVTLNDSYVDPGAPAPGDLVEGTLSIEFEELKATGILEPGNIPGSFAVTSPTYVMSSIIVS
jgi:hypothetical protein